MTMKIIRGISERAFERKLNAYLKQHNLKFGEYTIEGFKHSVVETVGLISHK